MNPLKSTKQQLYETCLAHIEARIISLKATIHDIQQSANEETKSSAGDKYETGRAMAQLEIDKHQEQLTEATKMKQVLVRISPDEHTEYVKSGSLIFTSRGNFYISVNAGKHQVEDQTFFTVSTASPIAQKLIGLKVNDSFTLNHQEFKILKIQ